MEHDERRDLVVMREKGLTVWQQEWMKTGWRIVGGETHKHGGRHVVGDARFRSKVGTGYWKTMMIMRHFEPLDGTEGQRKAKKRGKALTKKAMRVTSYGKLRAQGRRFAI